MKARATAASSRSRRRPSSRRRAPRAACSVSCPASSARCRRTRRSSSLPRSASCILPSACPSPARTCGRGPPSTRLYSTARRSFSCRRWPVVASSLLDLIGNTPLVELPRLSPPGRTIYAKLEGQNPTGSIKDRVALKMVEEADLEPGQELLEPTSGNTGISLALVAKVKGLKLTCVMPSNATPERRALLELYGATVIESPGELGSNGAVRMAQEIAERDDRYVMPFQDADEANPRS